MFFVETLYTVVQVFLVVSGRFRWFQVVNLICVASIVQFMHVALGDCFKENGVRLLLLVSGRSQFFILSQFVSVCLVLFQLLVVLVVQVVFCCCWLFKSVVVCCSLFPRFEVVFVFFLFG